MILAFKIKFEIWNQHDSCMIGSIYEQKRCDFLEISEGANHSIMHFCHGIFQLLIRTTISSLCIIMDVCSMIF